MRYERTIKWYPFPQMITSDTTSNHNQDFEGDETSTLTISRSMLLLGILVLAGLVAFVVLHVGEMERFAVLLSHVEPAWLVLAIILQAGTYLCAGMIWHEVTRPRASSVPARALFRFSVEQLSVNQIVPTGGLSGNLLVFQAMRRLGLPAWLAGEALVAEILSGYIAYATVAIVALATLFAFGRVTPGISYILVAFAVAAAAILSTILYFLKHKDRQLPSWADRFRPLFGAHQAAKHMSSSRVLSWSLLIRTSAFNVGIFVLDSATLWAMMNVAGAPIGIPTAFVAIVIAFIAGTVSFLPGGIGGFETGAVTVLTILGSPIEAALAGTLLFRGLTLWLPLIPGLMLARQDIKIKL
jgi:uncharacterized membrane protein YbhN (UPF0104 family)